jgi:hypothetical protein
MSQEYWISGRPATFATNSEYHGKLKYLDKLVIIKMKTTR